MSFLLSALGGLANHLLSAGGGYLLENVGKPLISRVGNYFSNLFGGSSLGQTATDKTIGDAARATFDGVKHFSMSDLIKRKAPVMAQAAGDAASSYMDRLGEVFTRGQGPGPQAPMQEGIERMRD